MDLSDSEEPRGARAGGVGGRKRARGGGPVVVVDLDAAPSPPPPRPALAQQRAGGEAGTSSRGGARGAEGAGGEATLEVLEVGEDGGVRRVQVSERLERCLACFQEDPRRLGLELKGCRHWLCGGCLGALAGHILECCAQAGAGPRGPGDPSPLECTLDALRCPLASCRRGLSHRDALGVLSFRRASVDLLHTAVLQQAREHFLPALQCPSCGDEAPPTVAGDVGRNISAAEATALRAKHGLAQHWALFWQKKKGPIKKKGCLREWCGKCGLAACAACGQWVPPPGARAAPSEPHRCTGSRLEALGVFLGAAVAARFRTDLTSGLHLLGGGRGQGEGPSGAAGSADGQGARAAAPPGDGTGYFGGLGKEDVHRMHQAQRQAAKSQGAGDKVVAVALGRLEALVCPCSTDSGATGAGISAEGVRACPSTPFPPPLQCPTPSPTQIPPDADPSSP